MLIRVFYIPMLYNTLYKLHLKYNFPLFKRGNCFYVPILYDCVYTNYILNTISPVFESIPSHPLVLWSPHIGSRGTSLEKFSHRNIGVHLTKQGCFGRLTVRATSCTRNFFKKPCTFREILIFTCFGPVLYEGSMEGV